MSEWMGVLQLAQRLGVDRTAIQKWYEAGQLAERGIETRPHSNGRRGWREYRISEPGNVVIGRREGRTAGGYAGRNISSADERSGADFSHEDEGVRIPGPDEAPDNEGEQYEFRQTGAGTAEFMASTSIRTLNRLLEAAEVDLDVWEVERYVTNKWEVGAKDAEQNLKVYPLWQVKAWFVRRKVRLDRPAVAVHPIPRLRAFAEHGQRQVALVIPDSQHGFIWSEDRTHLIPLHDRRAVDAVIQLADLLQPDHISLLGDMLDLAEWSTKYSRDPLLEGTTSATAHEFMADMSRLRAMCPTAEIKYLEGNHEKRTRVYLIEKAAAVAGLRAVGESEPMVSIPRLLGLDKLDIEYVEPYGTSYWLWDRVRMTHGTDVRAKSGATCSAVIAKAQHSTCFGHIHRFEMATKTVHGPSGPSQIFALSPGCLCRIDGAVPGVDGERNWQQGCAVLTFDGEHVHARMVPIHDGRIEWRGVVIQGQDRGDEYAEMLGLPLGSAA